MRLTAGEDFLGLLVLGGDGTDRGGTKAMSFGSPTPSGMLKLATIRRYQNFGHFGHHGRSLPLAYRTVRISKSAPQPPSAMIVLFLALARKAGADVASPSKRRWSCHSA